ncbi:unnamed protein product [Protopolystoma xenopodis]|uniref:Uncharacterized protein n=1 Tax=Protopolystoma xenopodis TaxID=117903 RepID=A0A3S5AUV1_9PLAT|nr:unnamed protein product [Protopolystoma xenopodis]
MGLVGLGGEEAAERSGGSSLVSSGDQSGTCCPDQNGQRGRPCSRLSILSLQSPFLPAITHGRWVLPPPPPGPRDALRPVGIQQALFERDASWLP